MQDLPLHQTRLLELADLVEKGELKLPEGVPIQFDIKTYRSDCGTAGCIAGFAVARWAPDVWFGRDQRDIVNVAREILGQDTTALFVPHVEGIYWGTGTCSPAQAAQACRNQALFGDPKWEEVAKQKELE